MSACQSILTLCLIGTVAIAVCVSWPFHPGGWISLGSTFTGLIAAAREA